VPPERELHSNLLVTACAPLLSHRCDKQLASAAESRGTQLMVGFPVQGVLPRRGGMFSCFLALNNPS
jgi:hypothetical protein